ncbi:MAG: TRAP transporter small permease [Syntrophobacterales bacterium]
MSATFSGAVKKVSHFLGHLERWVLILLVAFLVIFSLLQIVLRNFFATGVVWGDNLLRHGVLWISFLGAARATAENKHIRIDLLPRLLSARGKFVVDLVSAAFACALCLVLLYASWTFVQGERFFGDIAFAFIPYWWLELIFPFAFALMALRFGLNSIRRISKGPEGVET